MTSTPKVSAASRPDTCRRRVSPVPGWVPSDLPRSPGVYQFESECGTVLYVGKSIDLRRRVRGYFYGGGPKSRRLAEMIALARRVRVCPTGSDLEARLEEAERILTGRPCYNRALKNRTHGWYLEIDETDPFPRPRITRTRRRAGARYFGPFRGREAPERVARLVERAFRLRSCTGRIVPDASCSPCLSHGLDLCTAPCAGEVSPSDYRAQADRAVRVLADPGVAGALRREWVAAREQVVGRLAYEQAARIQRRLDALAEIESERWAFETPWLRTIWLVVLPHTGRSQVVLVPFVGGCVLRRQVVGCGTAGWRRRVEDVCYDARVRSLAMPTTLDPETMVPAAIVSDWLLDGGEGGLAIDLARHEDAAIAAILEARARALGDPVAAPTAGSATSGGVGPEAVGDSAA